MAAIPPPPPVTGVSVVKGEGLVAQQQFERGALILTEDPLVMCDTGKGFSTWDKEASAFYQEQLEYSTSMLWKAFNNLELFDQGAFNTLYTTKRKASKLEYVVDAFRHNGFHFGFRNVNNAHIILYRFICAAYHSCIPNATVMINEFAPDETLHPGQARLVATREIPAGSPIVIDYIPKLWKEDSAARQLALMARWGFDCNCEGCKPAKAVMDASERSICRTYHEKGLRLSAAELRLYIGFMSKLGKRDKDLSRLCLRLAHDHETRDEYREAMHIAQSGLLVEQHFYLKCHYGELSRICADCFVEDRNLQAEYRETERAARIFLD